MCAFAGPALGQMPSKIVVRNFSVAPAHYDAPNQAQMKSLLQGAEARPLSNGVYSVKDVKLQTFRVDGSREMLVLTPDCIFEEKNRTVYSPASLHVEAVDGKFTLGGEGFLFQQTNSTIAGISNSSSLIISNKVYSHVHPDLLREGAGKQPAATQKATPGVTPGSGLDVAADRFTYASMLGLAEYTGHVKVAGTNLGLTAGRLSFKIPEIIPGSERPRELEGVVADGGIVADYGDAHATGERAEYSPATTVLRVTGHPTWKSGDRAGSSDELEIDRTNQVFQAKGNGYLKLPGRGIGMSGFMPGERGKTNAAPAGPKSLEVRCADYSVRTNRAEFRGNVDVQELADGKSEGRMTCGRMTVTFLGTNELQSVVAEDQVVIDRGTGFLRGDRAVYDSTNNVLAMDGSPAWQAGERSGSADAIRIDVAKQEMRGISNAMMKLPGGSLGGQMPLASGMKPTALQPKDTATKTNQFALISADEYTVSPERAQFDGHVRIDNPRMGLACDQLAVPLPAEGERVTNLVANGTVRFEMEGEKGQKFRGRGDRAVYTFNVQNGQTNELMELTGQPTIIQFLERQKDGTETTNGTMQGKVMLLDCVRGSLLAPNYVITGTAPATGTNTLHLDAPKPKKKRKP